MTNTRTPRLAYSVDEAMAELGIGRNLIYSILNSGELRSIMCGGRRLIPAAGPGCNYVAVDEIIRQIRAASAAGLYYVALFCALTLPDICGALEAENGQASGPKYKAWLRANVPEEAADAELIYGLRCSLLHQGRARPHGGSFPIAAIVPLNNAPQVHNLSTVVNGEQVGWLSMPTFVDEVTRGAERWYRQFGSSETVARNMEKFARIRPEGLPPHFAGGPVIA
jgi:excisionase family DNA binding protein